MKRVLIGAVVGAIVLFVWQYAAWMFLGIHSMDHEPVLAKEDAVIAALEGTEHGVYWLPGISEADHKDPDSEGFKAWEKKYERGPRASIVYDPEGGTPMSPKVMGMGFVINVFIVLVVALMLRAAGIGSLFGRVVFVAGFGVFTALVMDIQNWNWMNYPNDWTRGFIIDHIAGMAILGVVLAFIVKPDEPAYGGE